MGQSTNGQICYGIAFEEDYEFPWNEYEDIEEWWRDINGYKEPFQLFDETGRVKCMTDKDIDIYFGHRREWKANNPIPVMEVNYCSGGYPMIIIADPSSFLMARLGYPLAINPMDLVAIENNIGDSFYEFVSKYKLSGEEGPQWYLSSYCG